MTVYLQLLLIWITHAETHTHTHRTHLSTGNGWMSLFSSLFARFLSCALVRMWRVGSAFCGLDNPVLRAHLQAHWRKTTSVRTQAVCVHTPPAPPHTQPPPAFALFRDSAHIQQENSFLQNWHVLLTITQQWVCGVRDVESEVKEWKESRKESEDRGKSRIRQFLQSHSICPRPG